MKCTQARRLFGAYWDDELTQAEREWLEAHFTGCPPCRSAYDQLVRTVEMISTLPRIDVAPDFAERALARARRANAEPDRVPVQAPRWIPITATTALLAVLAATVIQWTGLPRMASRDSGLSAGRETIQQPTLVTPLGPASGSRPGAIQAPVSGVMAAIPDSIFDHGEDVEFILDPVTLRKGRAHTVVRTPQRSHGQQATITF